MEKHTNEPQLSDTITMHETNETLAFSTQNLESKASISRHFQTFTSKYTTWHKPSLEWVGWGSDKCEQEEGCIAITRLTVIGLGYLESDLLLCHTRTEWCIVHDAECSYWDQVSLHNTTGLCTWPLVHFVMMNTCLYWNIWIQWHIHKNAFSWASVYTNVTLILL